MVKMKSPPWALGASYKLALYMVLFAISFASMIAAPPEKVFDQGQPEIQQSMDNMASSHNTAKRDYFHDIPNEENGYPALLINKVSDLLFEAEHMLNRVKNLKERRWVESFMIRFKSLAASLENIKPYIPEYDTTTSVDPNLLKTEMNTVSYTTTPSYDSFHNRPNSKHNKVNVKIKNNEHSKSRQDDDLVRELESLHDLKRSPAFNINQNEKLSSDPKKSLSSAPDQYSFNDAKRRIEERVKQDINELRRLGETDEDLIKLLFGHGHNFEDSSQRHDFDGDTRNQIKGMYSDDSRELSKNSQNPIVNMNQNYRKPSYVAYPSNNPPNPNYANKSLAINSLHVPLHNPYSQAMHSQNSFTFNTRLRHHGLQTAIQKLQDQGHPNYPHRQPYSEEMQAPMNDERKNLSVDGTDRNDFTQHQENLSTNLFNPFHGTRLSNSTIGKHLLPYPFLKKEFSEEMKRELKDGKVLLLSDNVVHSNFTADDRDKFSYVKMAKEV